MALLRTLAIPLGIALGIALTMSPLDVPVQFLILVAVGATIWAWRKCARKQGQ